MRCIECVTEPITPGHFCECCGRKLSLEERRGLDVPAAPAPSAVTPSHEPVPAAASPELTVPSAAPAARCESCGGPSEQGTLCATCRHVFDAVLGGATSASSAPVQTATEAPSPTPAATAIEPAVVEAPSLELAAFASILPMPAARQAVPAGGAATPAAALDEIWTELVGDAQPAAASVPVEPVPAMAAAFDDSHSIAAQIAAAAPPPAAANDVVIAEPLMPQAAVELAGVPHVETETMAEPANVAAIATAAAAPKHDEPAKDAEPASSAAPVVETRRPAKPAVPAAAKSSGAPVRAGRRREWLMGAAAALVVIGSIGVGLGAFWFKIQHEAPAAPAQASATTAVAAPAPAAVVNRPDEAPRPEAKPHVDAPPAVAPVAAPPAAPAAASVPAPVSAAVPAPAKPKPAQTVVTAKPAPKTPPKGLRQPPAPAPQVASAAPARVELPSREIEAPVPAPAAIPPPPPPAPSVPSASAIPMRPYFELNEVNQPPQVATRVEPRLPDELQGQSVSDVIVVHLLVSQGGRPFSVSLLRRSKTGQSLDDAVLAAVRQWTFAPARKKGEAVSCWMNIGVPVGH